jgi:8-hydroxy-5-deazaflavin:NADPH oxidoreductase
MDIVIVGAGNVGLALSDAWRKAGHAITFAVRNPVDTKAADLKKQGFGVTAIAGAGGLSDVIVLALPWNAVATSVPALGPVAGKIIVDATNPLTANLELAIGHTDSAGEMVARLAPHARVVKAFNTTGANNMTDSNYPGGKPMMPVACDDAEAKKVVMRLASDIGFEPIDTGPLAMSRHLEAMAVVWIKLAYAQKLGRDFAFALLRR